MEGASIRQISPDSVVVPLSLWQKLERLIPQMDSVLNRLDTLESSSVTGSEYLSRTQAMQFLHVGSTKLWELKNSGTIETTEKTGKVLYKTSSCRDYLQSQGFSADMAQERFRKILQTKKKL